MNTRFQTADRFGFAGTIRSNLEAENRLTTEGQLEAIWSITLQEALLHFEDSSIPLLEDFLRSNWGRQLADALTDHLPDLDDLPALRSAIQQTLTQRGWNGRSFWKDAFELIRLRFQVTEDQDE